MKKIVTLVLALVMVACLAISFAACNPTETPDGPAGGGDAYIDDLNELTQGVDTTNHVITVGNTAATSGAFAPVGVPFNYAQEAYFWYFENHTDGYTDAAGNKYTIDFKHYDDGFDGTEGSNLTTKLVEDDKVFALVGHFGSNTVAATMEYVEEMGYLEHIYSIPYHDFTRLQKYSCALKKAQTYQSRNCISQLRD